MLAKSYFMNTNLIQFDMSSTACTHPCACSDLDCNAKDFKGNKLDYCKVMGDPTKVADACKANPACKAFTMVNNGEGYLKTATGPTRYMESGVVFRPSG